MKVLIATAQVPFVRGGAERLAEGLLQALHDQGHEAEVVAIPFKWYPAERIPEQMLACSLLDITESCGEKIDRVIGLKFPAYLIPHPNKVLWLLHQHRHAYELWDTPFTDLSKGLDSEMIRDAVRQSDCLLKDQARQIFTISPTVSTRLWKFNAVASTPLHPPPSHAEQFYTLPAEDYLFFPSRLSVAKRQGLVLEALAHTRSPVKVCFAGKAESQAQENNFLEAVSRLGIQERVTWRGGVSDEEMRAGYAKSLGVVYTPFDEDLGLITLEAMLASKPVITTTDAGGPLEFVRHQNNGLIAEPTADSLAAAMDCLWADRDQAASWGRNGRQSYEELEIGWPQVVRRLLA
jgi:glycosyltransferase involved in cell wall biosynthesis